MGVDNMTLFTNAGGAGAAASDYIKDAFTDISVPATNNTNFTSTALTNPLSSSFANDDAPKYGAKTLWVKDLILIEDRSQWIKNKPTYKVVWNENYPGVAGYAYGNVRLRNSPNGISVDIRGITDAFGVGGVIRRVQWLLNPSDQATGTAAMLLDGVSTGNTAVFGGYTGTYTGYNHAYGINHEAANETKDIHDFRIQANEVQTLNVAGVVVYFENAGANIDCFPGSTYVDKNKEATAAISTLPIPSFTGRNGGKITITKTSANVYQTNKLEAPTLETVAVGSSGAGTLTVTTGTGASFPAGTAFVAQFGSSSVISSVVSVSTDTLTLSPALPIGVSGALYRVWAGGPTLPISATMYTMTHRFDSAVSNVANSPNGFGDASVGNFSFSHPQKSYRVWGSTLTMSAIDGYPGIAFGNSSMLQFDVDAAAMEFEFIGATNAILHATFTVNGIPAYGVNEGTSGLIRRTIFTDGGPGWKSVRMTAGASFGNLVVSSINTYNMNRVAGLTFGILSEFRSYPTNINFGVSGNISGFAAARRLYADDMYLTGGWGRTLSPTFSGGAAYVGTSTNATIQFGYYGKDFALIGQGIGSSMIYSIDGAGAVGISLNVYNTVATEGFHTLTISMKSVTGIIEAIEFNRTKSDMVNVQTFLPVPAVANIPTTYVQGDTPRSPKDGDIWLQSRYEASRNTGPIVWIYLGAIWVQLGTGRISDDPNVGVVVKTNGTTSISAAQATNSAENFNLISWLTSSATSPTAVYVSGCGEGSYNGKHHVVAGDNTAGSDLQILQIYDKVSWFSGVNTNLSGRKYGSFFAFNGNFWFGAGFDGSYKADFSKWNGGSWVSVAASLPDTYRNRGAFTIKSENKLHILGGIDGGNTLQAVHTSYNSAEATTVETVLPAASKCGGSTVSSGGGGVFHDITTTAYVWAGAAWSSAITSTNGTLLASDSNIMGCMAFAISNQVSVLCGYNASSAGVNKVTLFNGTSFSNSGLSNLATTGNVAGYI